MKQSTVRELAVTAAITLSAQINCCKPSLEAAQGQAAPADSPHNGRWHYGGDDTFISILAPIVAS